jgi:hypothetical protein
MPRDLFDWAPTTIDGVAIRTLSPLALIQIRVGLAATGVFGPRNDSAEVACAAHGQRWFVGRGSIDARPRLRRRDGDLRDR